MAIGVEEIKYFSQAKQHRRPARGFRLSPNRVSVRRLRAKLWTMLGLLGRYVRNVRLPLITSSSISPASAAAKKGGLHRQQQAASTKAPSTGKNNNNNNNGKPRRPPCMRSNSFYTRAVAECLDFIKGSNGGAGPVVEDNRGVDRRGHEQQQKVLKATK